MDSVPTPGMWVWAKPLHRAVQVQTFSTLWDVTTVDVVDQNGQTYHLSPEEMAPLAVGAPSVLERTLLIRIAAGAKLAHHLSLPDTLTAPFRAGLQPLPHQIKHLEDALKRRTTRLLLADEVGLGKTITAGLILTELKHRGLADRILVLTPAGLVPQWIQEMRQHFNLHFTPLYTDLLSTPETPKVWSQHDHIITSYDAVKPMEKRRGWSTERLRAHNHNRFDALIEAPWDVVVVDEAHRIAGATPGVARHGLAVGVATVAPHLLLLTGTPHQGKSDHFHRLVQLLDADTFSTPDTITPSSLKPHLLRTDKRHAVTLDGSPIFVKRRTELVALPEGRRSAIQKGLYSETIEYIRTGYAAAEKENRSGIGFLMILVQRLLSSSTAALEATLRTRLAFLEEVGGNVTVDDEEFIDPDSDLHEETVRTATFNSSVETTMLRRLLDLCADCAQEGPDAKASYLLELLRRVQQEEADPGAKFLLFTEFTGTQRMLTQFLGRHGYTVAFLNGSMDLDERAEAQRAFRENAQILVSTEAGGEGLNLQFAHNVVNYDLPWNPMRIEQRIGRVHRIGQKHPVTAYNLVLEGTIEHRVVEVLTSKLETILAHLGIDKLSDVLDTPSLDAEMQDIYKRAVRKGTTSVDGSITELVANIREQARLAMSEKTLIASDIDLSAIRQRLSDPVPFWLEQFAANANPPQKPDLREKETRTALERIDRWLPGQPVPLVEMKNLPIGTEGVWSLWRVGVRDGNGDVTARYQPLLLLQGDDVKRGPVAARIWDAVIAGEITITRAVDQDASTAILARAKKASLEACRQTYEDLAKDHSQRCDEDAARHASSVRAREVAIESIGLAEVRNHRLKKLRDDDKAWQALFAQRKKLHPILEPVLIIQVERAAG